jgi:hypothetical protein
LSTERKLRLFQDHLNKLAPTIKFTLEIESKNKLPFLDVLVFRNGPQEISLAVYRKKTNSGRFLSFNSCHPISVKAGVVKSLFLRAGKICSPEHLLAEKMTLTKMFRHSNYPVAFLQRHSVEKEKRNERVRSAPIATSVLPYVPGVSEAISNLLRRVNVRTVF